MTALAWLIPVALFLGLLGVLAFMWALRSGQFEDLDGAAYRILEDETPAMDSHDEARQDKPKQAAAPADKQSTAPPPRDHSD